MREELLSNLGHYAPSFLKMHISTRENLDNILGLSPRTSAAFIHEYVHFLQDITTIYGQKNIIIVVDYFKYVNMNQRNSTDRNLYIPYIPQQLRDPGAYYNGELQKLQTGNSKLIGDYWITDLTISNKTAQIGYNMEGNVEVVELSLTNSESSSEVFKFGSHCIIESMAFHIEQLIYPNELEDPNDFCYKAALAVFKYINPELANDPLNIIALCDASLMYFNPGIVFYNTLVKMRYLGYSPNGPKDIYDFVHSNEVFKFWGLTRINEIFNNQTLTAISSLNDYFTSEVFAPNKDWINYTLRTANKIRNENWGFFVDLASEGALSVNTTFLQLFSAVGMPLVTNDLGNAFFASPVENQEIVRPDILWVINQIYNIYINASRSQIKRCMLESWCKNSCVQKHIADYTDYRCIVSPWERAKDKDNLCAFSQVWRSWGLEDEIPTVNNVP
jgi:hypothetical protein